MKNKSSLDLPDLQYVIARGVLNSKGCVTRRIVNQLFAGSVMGRPSSCTSSEDETGETEISCRQKQQNILVDEACQNTPQPQMNGTYTVAPMTMPHTSHTHTAS
jgi:hypothetical protein